MQRTNKQKLEEFIRVDHAGERGAIKIYEGQLLALNTIIKDETLKKKIEAMKKHEDGVGSYILLRGEGYSRHISKVSILSANSKRTKQLPPKPCLWVNKKTDDSR